MRNMSLTLIATGSYKDSKTQHNKMTGPLSKRTEYCNIPMPHTCKTSSASKSINNG